MTPFELWQQDRYGNYYQDSEPQELQEDEPLSSNIESTEECEFSPKKSQ